MCKFNEFTCTDSYCCQRIFCDHSGNTCLFFDQGIQSAKKGSATGHYDTAVKNVGCQLWWSSLKYIVYSIYDLECRLPSGFQSFIRSNYNGFWKSGYQVTSSYFHRLYFRSAVCSTDINLDLLCSTFTDKEIMFLSHITD